MTNVSAELNGGFLGGTGDYRKVDLEGRWYAPLGTLGGGGQLGAGVQFVLGLTAKSGFIFGDAGPFFTELYSLGGVQYGVPLRGYDEFSITPNGFDPSASGNQASPTHSVRLRSRRAGARLSQSLYLSTFFDARDGNSASGSTWLFGAGFGAAVISPLGPIGVDLGYGFDRVDGQGRPDPGWQLHFKLGNFF
jgi:outer membrane protein insertion porin family